MRYQIEKRTDSQRRSTGTQGLPGSMAPRSTASRSRAELDNTGARGMTSRGAERVTG